MALTARPASLGAAPNTVTGRVSSGVSGVASMGDAPIEATSTRAEVQSNTNYSSHGFADWTKKREEPKTDPLTNTAAQFDTFSSTFLNLIDNAQLGKNGRASDAGSQSRHQKFVAKIITAYEDTAVVINRKAVPLGSKLSLSL